MSAIVQGILSIEDLISLHKSLVVEENFEIADWKLIDYSESLDLSYLKNGLAIYLLIKDNYPVYLGKSINAPLRLHTHSRDKQYDRAVIFHSLPPFTESKVLSYIEFLCYYSLWSSGYCLIYNSIDVWNTLPIRSQKGPVFKSSEIHYSHDFLQLFIKSVKELNLEAPQPPGEPQKLSYLGRKHISMNAIYWRPTIKPILQPMAIDYWNQKNEVRKEKSKSQLKLRCKFSGAGSFHILKGSRGLIMRNDYDQQVTYDLLKRMEVFKEKDRSTLWVSNYPFPKSNLMLHIIQAASSVNARIELAIEFSKKNLSEIECDWRVNTKL